MSDYCPDRDLLPPEAYSKWPSILNNGKPRKPVTKEEFREILKRKADREQKAQRATLNSPTT